MQVISEIRVFDGILKRFKHKAQCLGNLESIFAAYLPTKVTEASKNGVKAPCLYWLSGLTCTDENFSIKCSTSFERASQLGLVLIIPDTSPRGAGIAGEDDSFDFGTGAGFYVDATQEPWSQYYNMYTYITKELYELVNENLPVDPSRISISGHSMGGHGALTIALKNPKMYRSASAFAPISNPTQSPWGQKAFRNYLGDSNQEAWKDYDAVELLKRGATNIPIRVEQGTADQWIDPELRPESLKELADKVTPKLEFNYRPGYDHSFYFVSTFIKDDLSWHARHLDVCVD